MTLMIQYRTAEVILVLCSCYKLYLKVRNHSVASTCVRHVVQSNESRLIALPFIALPLTAPQLWTGCAQNQCSAERLSCGKQGS